MIQKQSLRRCKTSRPEVFCKKGVLENFVKFTGKHLCYSLFFNKVAGLSLQFYYKKKLWHRCFPVNFAKFIRTPFLQNIFGRLLLTLNICHRSFFDNNDTSNYFSKHDFENLLIVKVWVSH